MEGSELWAAAGWSVGCNAVSQCGIAVSDDLRRLTNLLPSVLSSIDDSS